MTVGVRGSRHEKAAGIGAAQDIARRVIGLRENKKKRGKSKNDF